MSIFCPSPFLDIIIIQMYHPEGSKMQYFIKQKYFLKEQVKKTHKINKLCVLLVSEVERKRFTTQKSVPLKVILHHEGYL